MKVDIRQVEKLLAQLAEINEPLLCDLELYDGDTPLNIPRETADEWDLTGLGNVYFIKCLLSSGPMEGWVTAPLSDADKDAILARARSGLLGDGARLG